MKLAFLCGACYHCGVQVGPWCSMVKAMGESLALHVDMHTPSTKLTTTMYSIGENNHAILLSIPCMCSLMGWRCGLYRLLPIGMQDILVWSVERFHSILLRVAFDAGPKLYYNHSDLASILQGIPHGGHWVMHTFFSHLASVWQHQCCSVMLPLPLLPLCFPPLCLFLVMHHTICAGE